MATAIIPAATALLRARSRDDGSVELHHHRGRHPALSACRRRAPCVAVRPRSDACDHSPKTPGEPLRRRYGRQLRSPAWRPADAPMATVHSLSVPAIGAAWISLRGNSCGECGGTQEAATEAYAWLRGSSAANPLTIDCEGLASTSLPRIVYRTRSTVAVVQAGVHNNCVQNCQLRLMRLEAV
jgi:hypothetical protein